MTQLPAWEPYEVAPLRGWRLRIATLDGQHAYVEIWPRPSYCDRGHWQVTCDLQNKLGIEQLDIADGFPRYYMSLAVAKAEMESWLRWRLYKERTPEPAAPVPPNTKEL